jgi:hypothetical protein
MNHKAKRTHGQYLSIMCSLHAVCSEDMKDANFVSTVQ